MKTETVSNSNVVQLPVQWQGKNPPGHHDKGLPDDEMILTYMLAKVSPSSSYHAYLRSLQRELETDGRLPRSELPGLRSGYRKRLEFERADLIRSQKRYERRVAKRAGARR
jgi:hypothetical protein